MNAKYALFYAAGVLTRAVGGNMKAPVFVVGTGRCGSTLLVEILGTHPGLALFPGEANDLWFPGAYPIVDARIETPPVFEDPRRFTETALGAWPDNHAASIQNILLGCRAFKGMKKPFVLKSAMISFMMGELLDLYPDARFIHIYRHPLAFIDSHVKKNWQDYTKIHAKPSEESFRQVSARYWRACMEEIDHVAEERNLRATGAFFDMSYETLCAQPEASLVELSQFLGCDPDRFGFDMSAVSNRNFHSKKLGDYDDLETLSEIMQPVLRNKGYSLDS